MNAKIRELRKEQDEWLVQLHNDAVKIKKRNKNLFKDISLQEVYDECVWDKVRGSQWLRSIESNTCKNIMDAQSIKDLERIERTLATSFHPLVKINLLLNIELRKERFRKK